MKDTGITRKIDELGRVVLPIELRKAFSMDEKDYVGYFIDTEERSITLKKREPFCVCCRNSQGLKLMPNGRYICQKCLDLTN